MTRCARCDWQPDPAVGWYVEQLEMHAYEAGHELCSVGRPHSLTDRERGTCERCLADVQGLLAGVSLLYDELPAHLGQPRGGGLNGDRPGAADGRPLPGGDILVLLGPGSQGLSDDGTTVRDGDVTSVAYELCWWEEEWRDARDEPDGRGPRSARAQVRDALGYLETRMRWAATSHGGFGGFAGDMRQLHGRLERATGRVRRPSTANASCFDCGGRLVYLVDPESGLEADEATCDQCGRSYDGVRYLLALKGAVEAAARVTIDGELYVTVEVAASETSRSQNTIKKWANDGTVRQAQSHGRRIVALVDVQTCDQARPRRRTA